MAVIYLADTGLEEKRHYFICGYIASVDQWKAFARKWDELCHEHLGGQPFCPFSIDLEHAVLSLSDQVLSDFAKCIVAHVDAQLWAAFPTYYLQKLEDRFGSDLKALNIKLNKFQICLANAIQEVVEQYSPAPGTERLAWVLARHTEKDGEDPDALLTHAFNVVRKNATSGTKRFFGAFSLDDPEALAPLQAASFFAWLKMRAYAAPYGPDEPAYHILRTAEIKQIGVLSSGRSYFTDSLGFGALL